MEVWKDVADYEGLYQISNQGRVRNAESVLKTFVCGSGYREIILTKHRKRTPKLIHRMVAEAFLPNPDGKQEVNHKDGNKFNNDVSNLEWVTPSENQRHSRMVLGAKSFQRSVVCVELQRTYESIAKAATDLGLKSPLIWKCCNGTQRTTGGYHWRYAEGGET